MPELDYDLGPITDDGRAEDRVLEQLRVWMPFYLERVDAARGLPEGTSPAPHDSKYFLTSFEERWAEQTPPAVLVVSPGTLGELELHGPRGTIAQWQQVNVTITVGGATEEGTDAKKKRYIAAARAVLLHQVAGDVVHRVRPLGQRYDLRTRNRERSRQRAAGGVRAALFVPDVIDTRRAFPTDPGQLTYVVPDSSRTAVERAVTPTPEAPS